VLYKEQTKLVDLGGWELTKNWKLIEEINNEAQTLKRILLESKPLNKNRMDVILGSEVVGLICHESSGHPSEGG